MYRTSLEVCPVGPWFSCPAEDSILGAPGVHWSQQPGAMQRANILHGQSLSFEIGKIPLRVNFGRLRVARSCVQYLKAQYDSNAPDQGRS